MALTDGAIKSAERILQSLEKDIQMMQPILAGDPRFDGLSKSWRGNTIRAALVAQLWRKEGRQTLAIHPEIVRECRLASSASVPMEVFRAIPYLNPMVVFPEPPVLPSWRNVGAEINNPDDHLLFPYDGKEFGMRMLGFMVHGQHAAPVWTEEVIDAERKGSLLNVPQEDLILAAVRQPTLTTDPAADRLGITAMCEVFDQSGNCLDLDTASFSIPFDGDMTVEQMVESQLERFQYSGVDDPEMGRKWLAECYHHIVAVLMYLASTTLDAEKVPSKVTAPLGKRTMARRPLSFYRIGWTVGAALTKMRYASQKSEGHAVGDLRHQQDPQHRRAHFKVVWTGPGRTIPKTAYVSPYWTHRERLGMSGVNTVRSVPRPG